MFHKAVSLILTFVLLAGSILYLPANTYAEEPEQKALMFNGYEFMSYQPNADDGRIFIEDGSLVYEIEKLALADWENKVYIENGVTFEKGNKYKIDFSIKADKDTYFSFYANQKGVWNPVVSQILNIGDYVEDYSFTTSEIDGANMDMEILFQFGGYGNSSPLRIEIVDFSITTISSDGNADSGTVTVNDFGGLFIEADVSQGESLYKDGGKLVYEMIESGRLRAVGLPFKKGAEYVVEYSVSGNAAGNLAVSVDPEGSYFAAGEITEKITENVQTFTYRTGVQNFDGTNELTIDISGLPADALSKVVFDKLEVKEAGGADGKKLRNAFLFGDYKLTHEESGGGVAELTVGTDGYSAYTIEKLGASDWNNKVSIGQGVLFEKDMSYSVDFCLEADSDINMFFGVNPKGKWEPKVAETLPLKQGENNFSFVTGKQQTDEDVEILFQFGGLGNSAPSNIRFKSISIKSISTEAADQLAAAAKSAEPKTLVNDFNFAPSEDYKFRGFVLNDISDSKLYIENGLLVYDIETFGVNQLIKNDLQLGKDREYTVEITLHSEKELNAVMSINQKYAQKPITAIESVIGVTPKTLTTEFSTEGLNDEQGQLMLDLSNNTVPAKLYIDGFVIRSAENPETEEIPFNGSWQYITGDKSIANERTTKDGVYYYVTRFSGNPWENKFEKTDIAEFKKGKTYVVEFDIESTEDIIFTYMIKGMYEKWVDEYEADEDGTDEESTDEDSKYFDLIWERNYVEGSKTREPQHYRFSFTAAENINNNKTVFEFGGQGNTSVDECRMFISNIKITECTAYQNDISRFPGAQGGVFSYEHGLSGAHAVMYTGDAGLVYSIDKMGLLDWHNKITLNQGIKLENGYRYRFDVTAKADRRTRMVFGLVSQKDWEDKIKKSDVIGSEWETFSFETKHRQEEDENAEISLGFGGMNNYDGSEIVIQSIKVYKMDTPAPRNYESIDEDNWNYEFEATDFNDIVDYRGYRFKSVLTDGAIAYLSEEGDELHYDIAKFGEADYNNKVLVDSGLHSAAGKSYEIEFTAKANRNVNLSFVANVMGEWNPAASDTITLTENYETHRLVTRAQNDSRNLEILFQFGGNRNTGTMTEVQFSDFKISEFPLTVGTAVLGNGITATSSEDNGAKAMLYSQNGKAVYTIENFGPDLWNNKIIAFDVFDDGQNYKIQTTLNSTASLNGKFYVSPAGTWAPILEENLALSPGSNEFTFYTSYSGGADMEFQFQFGGQDNSGEAVITFDNFAVIESDEIADGVNDEGTVTFKGTDFSHSEVIPAMGALYANTDRNMVYYAAKLGNADWHNKVYSEEISIEAGKTYELITALKPEKGLDVTILALIDDSPAASVYKRWHGPGAETETALVIPVQTENKDVVIAYQFGQEEYAIDRERNKVEFTKFNISESTAPVDEGTVHINSYDFTHSESGETAEGIAYTNDGGKMVYYAQKLGNAPDDNKVHTTVRIDAGKTYDLVVKVKPQKGLEIGAAAVVDSTGEQLAAETVWAGDNSEATVTLQIPAKTAETEIAFELLFGQTAYAEAREDNKIEIYDFSVSPSAPSSSPVTLGGYTFDHSEEGSSVAKGTLSNDEDGSMIYYAEKLSNSDWHNKVFTTIDGLGEGKKYRLTVEIELEKGLDMVATMPGCENSDNDGDAWYKNWIGEGSTNTITYNLTAKDSRTELNFQFGQENYADAREDNHIKFKSISLTELMTVEFEPVIQTDADIFAEEIIETEEIIELEEAPEPEEPIELEEAVEAEEPMELEEAVEAEEPIELEEAVEPEEPMELEEAVEPEEPIELEEAVEPEEPIELEDPVEAEESIELEEAVEAEEPMEPFGTAEQNEPADPVELGVEEGEPNE